MPVAILSPHHDDAVLSCWHVLSGPGEVLVINVFAGIPGPQGGDRAWDRGAGVSDSAAALDGHPSHVAVPDAARALEHPLALYADLPHDPGGPPPAALGPPEVHRLDPAALAAKHRALGCYASQLESLERPPLGPLTDALLRRETVWRSTLIAR